MNNRISVILPENLRKDLDVLLKEKKVDQSTLIRQLLYKSVKEEKLKHALDLYRKGKVSFGKAAEIAGVNIWEFIDLAHKENIQLHYSLTDAEEEIRQIQMGNLEKYISKTESEKKD